MKSFIYAFLRLTPFAILLKQIMLIADAWNILM